MDKWQYQKEEFRLYEISKDQLQRRTYVSFWALLPTTGDIYHIMQITHIGASLIDV